MIKERVPWWARIGAKLVLARLPAAYGTWRRLNLFGHGAMHQAEYAVSVFQQHFARCPASKRGDFVGLEIGPGDSLASAVIGRAYGARHTYLVDVGRFATTDVDVYRGVARRLRKENLSPPDLDGADTFESVLRACQASYLTEGLASMRDIPSASVDFIWSHAVLEHIRRHEFAEFMREMRRVLRDDGVCSHQIDLRDHLGGALNNMRISSRWWEREWMVRSGFYTNRLRAGEMIDAFGSAGFDVDVIETSRWDSLPTPRHVLAEEFRKFTDEELLVKTFTVVLKPRAQSHPAHQVQ